MYEGIETASLTKLDTRFEFDWYLRTVDFIAEEKALETQNALYQLFLGAMRVVLDYKWLPECKGYNLDDISIIASIEEDKMVIEKMKITKLLENGKCVFIVNPERPMWQTY